MIRRRWSFAAMLWVAAPGFAQVLVLPPAADPGVIQQRQMEEERRRAESEREERKLETEPLRRVTPETHPPAEPPEAETIRFFVQEIRFTRSELLDAGELESIAGEFRGRMLGLADLKQLAARVNQLYRNKGVVTALAVIPPQDVSAGLIEVRLIEGRLGKFHINGNDSTDAAYVAARLGLQPGDLMDLNRLEAALVRFNRTNDVQLRAELKPGERFATSDVWVAMREPPRHELLLTLDNQGSSLTGKERVGIAYVNRSLLGYRDDANLSLTQAEGQTSQSARYGFPINTWGGRLNLGYYIDKTEIKNGPLASLNITGESTAQIVTLRQPTWVDAAKRIDIVAGAKKRWSTTWAETEILQRIETEDHSLGVDVHLFDDRSSWFASYSRAEGDADGAGAVSYVIDRGAIRYSRTLAHGWSVRGNLWWQATKQRALPSSEQFIIGGEGSVRGYPLGVYSGYNGVALNLELHHPLLKAHEDRSGLGASGFFFADYGRVKPQRPPNSTLRAYDALTGIGWGLHATLGNHAYGRVTLGYGLNQVPTQSRNYEVSVQLIATVF